MAQKDEVFDSPMDWVAEHIQDYVESDGQKGHMWRGLPTLLLTTCGRKSGKQRRTTLIYGQDSDNYIIVASRGGHAKHPAWYLNLIDNPEVEVQVKADKFSARAHTAEAEEKKRLWPLMAKIFPTYNNYQAKTSRDIPVIVLEPT